MRASVSPARCDASGFRRTTRAFSRCSPRAVECLSRFRASRARQRRCRCCTRTAAVTRQSARGPAASDRRPYFKAGSSTRSRTDESGRRLPSSSKTGAAAVEVSLLQLRQADPCATIRLRVRFRSPWKSPRRRVNRTSTYRPDISRSTSRALTRPRSLSHSRTRAERLPCGVPGAALVLDAAVLGFFIVLGVRGAGAITAPLLPERAQHAPGLAERARPGRRRWRWRQPHEGASAAGRTARQGQVTVPVERPKALEPLQQPKERAAARGTEAGVQHSGHATRVRRRGPARRDRGRTRAAHAVAWVGHRRRRGQRHRHGHRFRHRLRPWCRGRAAALAAASISRATASRSRAFCAR